MLLHKMFYGLIFMPLYKGELNLIGYFSDCSTSATLVMSYQIAIADQFVVGTHEGH